MLQPQQQQLQRFVQQQQQQEVLQQQQQQQQQRQQQQQQEMQKTAVHISAAVNSEVKSKVGVKLNVLNWCVLDLRYTLLSYKT